MASTEEVYAPDMTMNLYEPTSLPPLPTLVSPNTFYTKWPLAPRLSTAARQRVEQDPLEVCCEHKLELNRRSTPVTITVIALCSGGRREDRSVQVWTARTSGGSSDLMVARIYDPLFVEESWTDRFSFIDRCVAVEHETYSRLKHLDGALAPRFLGVFVAEIPVPMGFRHVYVVLLRHVEGSDIRQTMAEPVERVEDTEHTEARVADLACAEHKASIIDAAARVLLQFFQLGIHPKDLKDNNAILQRPYTPSDEDFCPHAHCPFRNWIHIDFATATSHAFAPRVFLIDFELALFYDIKSWVGEADLQLCRRVIIAQWSRKDPSEWIQVSDVYRILRPYGFLPYEDDGDHDAREEAEEFGESEESEVLGSED
ncbi:hypothetical protein C8R43DRAFT_1115400 [Mycena crocata]|nr:hypothetical protein C8R43DRAFT_1115400 [Mycena crocata]